MSSSARQRIPDHLKCYVVSQDYSRYTPEDQAVWRFVLRQLKDFLSLHAHSCYVDGLAKTGISVERIPDINEMDEKLQEFGWGAVPVSGFIPPAAFMEFQSLGILPIASDMRTIDHLLYTPAPDIVHEAAGHAPILVDEAFSAYLRRYAEVAKNAIISREDLDIYAAIRDLSDLKENPSSTEEMVLSAENRLQLAIRSLTHVSEAAYLGRMNWWTAEYGLIGSIERPYIFGAGLLSSPGESRWCLNPKVKKIPLTVDCLKYSYDITEPQPQLFVTPDFETLNSVLDEMAKTMSYQRGGRHGLEQARLSNTVNTVQLNSGLQMSGVLHDYLRDESQSLEPAHYLKFSGPCQLSLNHHEIAGHGRDYHSQGFGSPLGFSKKSPQRCLSSFNEGDLMAIGLQLGRPAQLEFTSGVLVDGIIRNFFFADQALVLISWDKCRVTLKEEVLFDPSWGVFDMAVGSQVVSVFGGPADRAHYGRAEAFTVSKVPPKAYNAKQSRQFQLYSEIRQLRESKAQDSSAKVEWNRLRAEFLEKNPEAWLAGVELLELGHLLQLDEAQLAPLSSRLARMAEELGGVTGDCIRDGIKLADLKL